MRSIRYFDFDLLIERADGPGGYEARVVNAPSGEFAPVDFSAPFSEMELENFLLKIGRRRNIVRGLDTPEGETVKEFGARLFETVFKGDVRIALATSLGETDSDDLGLRLRLRLNECPELADLPWEYLYDKSTRRFLALSEWTPVIRYLDLPGRVRPLAVDGPLRVLGMVSGPTDYPVLSVQDEWSKLEAALRGLIDAGRVHLTLLPDGTLASLNRALRREDFHVFHYIGHGGLLPGGEDGVLVLEDDNGRGLQVSGLDIGVSLHDHRTMRMAFLNSCEGARAGIADPYSGTAQTLVQQGIPAVVAMQFEISDEAAITFSQALYEAIADGYPLDASMAEARKAIRNQPNATEWGTPVLYLRAADGRIFDMAAPPAGSGLSTAGSATVTDPVVEHRGATASETAPDEAPTDPAEGQTLPGGTPRLGERPTEERHAEPDTDETARARRRRLAGIAAALAILLVFGVIALVVTRDHDTPSAADRSQAEVLSGAQAPYFAADECVPGTPVNAPFASALATSELIKCGSQSVPFSGTFWCADSQGDFATTRRDFLGEAVDGVVDDIPQDVSPAGSDNMVDGVRKTYHHQGDGAARVYWDSESALCGAELQAASDDLEAAVAFWSQGTS